MQFSAERLHRVTLDSLVAADGIVLRDAMGLHMEQVRSELLLIRLAARVGRGEPLSALPTSACLRKAPT
jgi:hypothetical protein